MEHSMKLRNDAFNLIKDNIKTVEMRLCDEKRKLICIGDDIIFTNTKNNEIMKVKVVNLNKFNNFKELYNHYDKIQLGYLENENAIYTDMYEYYSKEQINKYGVLAIEIKKTL